MTSAQLAMLMETAIQTGAVLLAALLLRNSVRWRWVAVSVVLLILAQAALTRGFHLLPRPDFLAGLSWNWTGFTTLLAVTLAGMVLLPGAGFRPSGLTWAHQRGSLAPTLAVTLPLCALLTGFALADVFGPGDRTDTEAILFNLTAGPAAEELFYRGLLLAGLAQAFGRPARVLGAQTGWGALLAAFCFGAAHLIGWSSTGLSFNWMMAGYTFAAGLILVWIRERSGSLAQPFLIHAWGNTVQYLL